MLPLRSSVSNAADEVAFFLLAHYGCVKLRLAGQISKVAANGTLGWSPIYPYTHSFHQESGSNKPRIEQDRPAVYPVPPRLPEPAPLFCRPKLLLYNIRMCTNIKHARSGRPIFSYVPASRKTKAKTMHRMFFRRYSRDFSGRTTLSWTSDSGTPCPSPRGSRSRGPVSPNRQRETWPAPSKSCTTAAPRP